MELPQDLVGIKVKFKSYYKFTFTFSNEEGYEVSAGGISDGIYRCSIQGDREYTIEQVGDECGGSLYVSKDGQIIYESPW